MNTMNFAYNIILLLIKNYTIVREHKTKSQIVCEHKFSALN